MKKTILFDLCFIAVLLFTACQPTPETPIVVNKGDSLLEERIRQSPAALCKYYAPESWTEDFAFDGGNLTVYIDASINVPETDNYPVAEVAPVKFTQDQADKALSSLIKGKTLYKIKRNKTKQEIEEEILAIQKNIASPDSDLNSIKDTDTEGYKESLQELQSEIADLRERQKTAPDKYVPEPASLTFTSGIDNLAEIAGMTEEQKRNFAKNTVEFSIIEGQAELGKSEPAKIRVISSELKIQNEIDFKNMDKNCDLRRDVKYDTKNLNGINISKEQAVKIAEDEIKELGLIDYALAAVGSDAIDIPATRYSENSYKDDPKCYVMYFTHSVGNIPVTFVSKYTSGSLSKGDKNLQEFSSPWPDETLKIVADDNGINTFMWYCPYKVIDTVSENVQLLSFDRIKDIFREQIKVQGIWDSDPDIVRREIHIEDIVLGMAKIPKKDDPDINMLVPAWDFFGYSVYKYRAPQPGGYRLNADNEYTEKLFMHSFLTINAIDGSVIQRQQQFNKE